MMINVFSFIGALARKAVYSAEHNRIDDKFDHFDHRLDILERDNAVIKSELQGLKNTSLANQETIQKKVDDIAASQQSLDLIVKHHLAYMDSNIANLKEMLYSCVIKK